MHGLGKTCRLARVRTWQSVTGKTVKEGKENTGSSEAETLWLGHGDFSWLG